MRPDEIFISVRHYWALLEGEWFALLVDLEPVAAEDEKEDW